MTHFRILRRTTPLVFIASLVIGILSVSPAHATKFYHYPSDYCTGTEYLVIGGDAAIVHIRCRTSIRQMTVGQHRRKGRVIAYDVQTCHYREHNGTAEIWNGTPVWAFFDSNGKSYKNIWDRFTPMLCKVKMVPPSGYVS